MPIEPSTKPKIMSISAFRTSGSRASDPEGSTGLKSVSLTAPEAEPEVMLGLNCSTPNGAMEDNDSDIGEAGEVKIYSNLDWFKVWESPNLIH